MTDGTKGAERSGDRPDHLLDDDDSRSTEVELREFADLDQITYYLQGRLPPDEAAAVERRLEEDVAFRSFAWPLLAAWAVRTPRNGDRVAAERRERHWELFKRYTTRLPVNEREHARKERRVRWRLIAAGTLLVVFALVAAYLTLYLAGAAK